MLEGLGLVRRLGFNKSSFFYELVRSNDHHHHVVCRRCGRVEELENISEKFVNEVVAQTKFKIEDHNLEFFGLCKECNK
jgi:Fe2+ or Zn2+ uptake regulation protein